MSLPLSKLAEASFLIDQPLIAGIRRYLSNPYSENNPTGVINLGTAENQLMQPELLPKLNELSAALVSPEMLSYGLFHGSNDLFAAFLNRHLNPVVPIDPAEEVTIQSGCTSTVNNIIQALTNPGDGVLIPTPYYGGFDFDTRMYAQAKIVEVPTSRESDFTVTVADLDAAMIRASEQGVAVKVFLLANPQNPQGTIIGKEHLLELLQWCADKQIHAIVDEIYALSIFGDKEFVSVLSIPELPDPTNTHVLWGISKDLALNGFRMGVCITRHKSLQVAMRNFCLMTNISSVSDRLMTRLLSDTEWMDWFVAENKKRLRAQYERTTVLLDSLGIKYLASDSTFFIYMDLHHMLDPTIADKTEAESKLWKDMMDRGVVLSPGFAFHNPEPGWFRLVFTLEWKKLELGIQRAFGNSA
ncbi:hypothetical protein HK105_200227 [Polyrhizophydium stewartii]|uniref:Aminotransferase class I/classII large domain-containing protein n=1 Tax=Polyrhizophydium stewartii TaxID=2732419 RepID=A0ABR4NL20_9FUNG|nr:hypothetical protein HK105_005768 [Polyrhizophydium stewartii]